MRRTFKTLLLAIVLAYVMLVMLACDFGGVKMAGGTYKLDTVQINGKTVALPDYDAMPVRPKAPESLPEAPWWPKPVPGPVPVESDYISSSMTENEKIVARAEFAMAKAEHTALAIRADAWQAQKDVADAVTAAQRAANEEEWNRYNAQIDAYYYLSWAWERNCQNTTYNAIKAAGISADLAEDMASGYPLFMILKTLEINVAGNVISFKNFALIEEMLNDLADGVLGLSLEFVELTYEVNSDNVIVLSVGAPGMRVGVATSLLTYEGGKINFELVSPDLVSLKIVFAK